MKTDLKREKQELRKQIKKKISELSIAYCKSADEKIMRLQAWMTWKKVLMALWSQKVTAKRYHRRRLIWHLYHVSHAIKKVTDSDTVGDFMTDILVRQMRGE